MAPAIRSARDRGYGDDRSRRAPARRRPTKRSRPGPRDTSSSRPASPRTDWSLVHPTTFSAAPVQFSDLGVPQVLCAALQKRGIAAAFPVQVAALPDCLAGRDVCGMAPTGSGKTLAFGLAILSRLEAAPPAARAGRRRPSALVLV